MEGETDFNRFWELASATQEISPELSKTMIHEMLDSIKQAGKPIPQYFKKMICFKCFEIFSIGENCKVYVHSHKKHPNLKVVEYHCLGCKNKQRINAVRSKVIPQLTPIQAAPIPQSQQKSNEIHTFPNQKKFQQRKKLFSGIFS